MTTADKIQRLRKGNNLTQEQFAELINVSRQTVYNWESGESLPTKDNLQVIRDSFGLPLSSLYNEEYKKESISLKQKPGAGSQPVQTIQNKNTGFKFLTLLLFVFTAFNIRTLSHEINYLDSRIASLQTQIHRLNGILYNLYPRDKTPREKYPYYNRQVTAYNRRAGTVTLQLEVTPTDYSRSTTASFTVATADGSYTADAVYSNNVFTANIDLPANSTGSIFLYLKDGDKVRSSFVDYLPSLLENHRLTLPFAALIGSKIMVVEDGKVDFRNSRIDMTIGYIIDEENPENSVYPVGVKLDIYCDGEFLDSMLCDSAVDDDFYAHIRKQGNYTPKGINKGNYSTYINLNKQRLGQGYTVLEDKRIKADSQLAFRLVITDNHGAVAEKDVKRKY